MESASVFDRRRFIQSAALGTWAACGSYPAIAAAAGEPLQIGREPQLFLDDWIIERSDGLKRTLHQPKKQGLIKQSDGSDWDRGDVYHGNIVCRDEAGRFHMTYRYMWSDPGVRDLHPSIGDDKAHWFRESIGYATSDDGIRWEKPELGLVLAPVSFRKQKEYPFEIPERLSNRNNLGCPIDFIYDLNAHGNVADPARCFLLRVAKREDTHPFAQAMDPKLFFAARWPDFARDPAWMAKLTPIPGGNLSPRGFRTLCGFDQDRKVWFSTTQDLLRNWMPRGGRDIARYHSSDLNTWQGPELVLPVQKDELRDRRDWVEYMDMTAYRVGGQSSGLWLGQLGIFHSDRSDPQFLMPTGSGEVWRKGVTEIRLMVSRDAGQSWQRVAGKEAWLPYHADPHGYDRLVFNSFPVRVNDELWFYYSAWDGDHLIFNKDGSLFEPGFSRMGRVARATLRVDGYLSLDARDSAGRLETKPFFLAGDKLSVNFAGRGLRAELRTPEGQALAGLSFADSGPVTGDGASLPVRWSEQALAAHRGKTVRLALELSQGSLYSFSFS